MQSNLHDRSRLTSFALSSDLGLAVALAVVFLAQARSSSALPLLMSASGGNSGDMLGNTVASVGDLNGDGWADFAAAATGADAGGQGAGRVLVFFGARPANPVPDLIVDGVAGDLLGVAIAGGGDLNRDGYDDLALGSWLNSDQGPQSGKVLVLFGGPVPDNIPDRTLRGASAGVQFGRSLAIADLTGDGVADLAVGAPGVGTGVVEVFHGDDPFDTTADDTLSGEDVGERFGFAMAPCGDLNHDGFADLAVGADRANDPSTWAGAVRIFTGGPGFDLISDLTLRGETAGSFFGSAIAAAGDVDGDGAVDLLVGAKGYNTQFTDAGRAYLFRGGNALDAVPDLTISGLDTEEFLGTAVGGGADVNRDGKADILIGVPGYALERGAVRIYFGGSPLNNTLDDSILGEALGDHLGFAVSGVADSDRNGAGEVLSGAWARAAEAGRIYLHGDPTVPIGISPTTAPRKVFELGSPYPNPANAQVSFELTLGISGPLQAELFDVQGRRLRSFMDGWLDEGVHWLRWNSEIDGRPAPAGIYFVRVQGPEGTRTQKVIIRR